MVDPNSQRNNKICALIRKASLSKVQDRGVLRIKEMGSLGREASGLCLQNRVADRDRFYLDPGSI